MGLKVEAKRTYKESEIMKSIARINTLYQERIILEENKTDKAQETLTLWDKLIEEDKKDSIRHNRTEISQ